MKKLTKVTASIGLASALAFGGATAAFATVANVGGGTWNYGTSTSGSTKSTWSNYVHNTKKHSSTAIIADKNVKVTKEKTVWSNASASANKSYTGYAYWATY